CPLRAKTVHHIILVLPCLLRRRVTRTLLSTPRCAGFVRRGAGRQQPSFQIQPLWSDRFRRPLGPIVRAPSLDARPLLPSPLLCHLTSRPRGQCAVGQSVPGTVIISHLGHYNLTAGTAIDPAVIVVAATDWSLGAARAQLYRC